MGVVGRGPVMRWEPAGSGLRGVVGGPSAEVPRLRLRPLCRRDDVVMLEAADWKTLKLIAIARSKGIQDLL